MSDTTTRFACAACNKSYRWKPEIAGRKVKCTCSHVMVAPQAPPAPAPVDDDLIPLADEDDSSPPARTTSVSRPAADLAHTVMGHQILSSTAVGAPAITADPPSKRPAPKPKLVAAPKPSKRAAPHGEIPAIEIEPRESWFKWWYAVIAVVAVLGVAIYFIVSRGR